jgi:CheY-like chemotaxis protein
MDSADGSEAGMNAPAAQAAPLVLIVDDEAPIAQALAFIIEDAGYAALTAFRGVDALQLARQLRPGLVFTDMMMPQMTGTALIVALRADAEAEHYPAPCIIAMTAGGLKHAAGAGADAVLEKPFSIEEVEALLRRWLPLGAQQG